MTRLEQARAIVESLARQHPSLTYANRQIEQILAGANDGSVSPGNARVLDEMNAALAAYASALAAASRL